MDCEFPPPVIPGDRIAIAAPCGGIRPFMVPRLMRGIEWLEAQGFQVVCDASPSSEDIEAPGREERARELNRYFGDPDVRAIFMAIGGYGAVPILDLLDFNALVADPKVVVGYSDATALGMAIMAKAGLVWFHGPTVVPELGDAPGPLAYSSMSLMSSLSRPERQDVRPASHVEDGAFVDWRVADDAPRRLIPSRGWRTLRGGLAEGVAFGGNLETMCSLVGTDYLRLPSTPVLFLESFETDSRVVEQRIFHLHLAGVFRHARAIVFGSAIRMDAQHRGRVDEAVLAVASQGSVILSNVDFGHRQPMFTWPMGAAVTVDADGHQLTFRGMR